MKTINFCEVISIESLKAKSEIIKKLAQEYIKNQEKTEEILSPTQDQINFIKNNKEELPELEKAIIHLHFWEEMSISEISEMLDMSYKTISQIKHEAIHRLRLNYLIEFSAPKSKSKSKQKLELVS